MKTLKIDNCDISLLCSNNPVIFSNIDERIEYEWFYFEVRKDDLHFVCILSYKDCFNLNNNKTQQQSIYFTLYKSKKVVAYSYIYFSDKNSKSYLDNVGRWLTGKTNILDLWLPDHSMKKYINIKIKYDFCTDDNKYQINQNEVKHFWQFINSGNDLHSMVNIYNVSDEFSFSNLCKRNSFFFDYPLKLKLQNQSAGVFDLSNASYYFDHNFGFSPLYSIKEPWYWWHESIQNGVQVNYYFPHLDAMYQIKKMDYMNEKSLDFKIFDAKNINFIRQFRFNLFGIKYPKILNLNREIIYDFTMESAPFYHRIKSLDSQSTLEALYPLNIKKSFNQILIKSRKIELFKNIHSKDEISSYFNFIQICKKITFNHGKSFYISSLVLASKQRNSSYFIYVLCRLIDDATDERNVFDANNKIGSTFSYEILEYLWSECDLLSDEFIELFMEHLSNKLFAIVNYDSAIDFILNARILIKELELEKSYFIDLINGQKMDENFVQPFNINDLYLYCFRVAGVVGIMMAKIFHTKNHLVAMNAAEKLGCAMQITNILRDVKEDFENNRIYIPIELFSKYKIENFSLFFMNNYDCGNKNNLINELVNLAVLYYCEAIEGLKYIPSFRARLCVKLMIGVYGSILGKIVFDKSIVFKQRIVISHFKKLIIFLKILFGFHPLKVANLINEKELL
ncbi:phytoene/squalene synthase family protein [Pigmentibacter ruber]|uniref:phytoene/squalene synthase family protein n=1 Tax=Pigmentibacter ruber TaxID=2683196 RepID=UPI00131D8FD0|nr:squalene/phytoene synthase family protein [Pigmentibacter ruber]